MSPTRQPRLRRWAVGLRHDHGSIEILTTATTIGQAIAQVIAAEGAPLRSVTSVRTVRSKS